MRVRYTEPALLSLKATAERTNALYGKERARALATTLRQLVEGTLPLFPLQGREGKAPGTRELVVSRPCFVVFRVVGDTIVALLHQSQRWPKA